MVRQPDLAMTPALAKRTRGGMAKIFPSLPVSFLLTLLLIAVGFTWLSFSAGNEINPLQELLPRGPSTGKKIPLTNHSESVDLYCGGQEVEKDRLFLCNPGQNALLKFSYAGRNLWLELRRAEAYGQLQVKVNGHPANQLKVHIVDSGPGGQMAGYLPLISPFEHASMREGSEWIPIHFAKSNGPHAVTMELKSRRAEEGGNLLPVPPLVAAGIDLPKPLKLPAWPGLLLAIAGGLGFVLNLLAFDKWPCKCQMVYLFTQQSLEKLHELLSERPVGLGISAGLGIAAIGLGQIQQSWLFGLAGVALLGLAGLNRPAIWLGSLLFGLPFHLYPVPILPGLAINLVEIGVTGGLLLVLVQYIRIGPSRMPVVEARTSAAPIILTLAAFTAIALFAAMEAQYQPQALREWRTVFLASLGFMVALATALRMSHQRETDAALMVAMWIAGAVAISLFGFYAFTQGVFVTDVDGVRRIRGLYGSPNNLALYLDRTLLVSVAMFLFARNWPRRLLWILFTAIQAGALLLTFSKGGLFLGLPAGLLFLLGAVYVLRKSLPESQGVFWLLTSLATLGIFSIIPFLNTPRFAGILDWQGNFPSFVRWHLWRSGIRMFLDNWFLGIGPDNFLYWYRGTYIEPAVWNEPSLNHPHNFLIDLLSRLGLTGLISGMAVFAVGFQAIGKQMRDSVPSRMSMGLSAACVAGLAHGLVDASFALPDLMVTWVLLLGLACLLDLKRTESLLT